MAIKGESSTGPITAEIRMDLKHQLKQSRNAIQVKYASFVARLCVCMKEKDVDIKDLGTFLLQLPALESGDLDPGLLTAVKSELEEADDMNKIFNLLAKKCTSFVHYDIFQCIKEKYCNDIDSEELNYSEHFKQYIKMYKISEFFAINPDLKKKFSDDSKDLADDSKELVLKIDSINLSSKVIEVDNLRQVIAETLGLRPSVLRLVSIEEGCVIVTFLIAKAVGDIIFHPGKELSESQRERFRSLSVQWLRYGSYEITNFAKELSLHHDPP